MPNAEEMTATATAPVVFELRLIFVKDVSESTEAEAQKLAGDFAALEKLLGLDAVRWKLDLAMRRFAGVREHESDGWGGGSRITRFSAWGDDAQRIADETETKV